MVMITESIDTRKILGCKQIKTITASGIGPEGEAGARGSKHLA